MPTGKKLSEYEIGQIWAYKDQGLSNSKIARTIGRSNNVINNLIRKKEEYGAKKHKGRPQIFDNIQKRRILRNASNSMETAGGISSKSGVNGHLRTVQRLLKNSENIKYSKVKKKPPLKKRIKING